MIVVLSNSKMATFYNTFLLSVLPVGLFNAEQSC